MTAHMNSALFAKQGCEFGPTVTRDNSGRLLGGSSSCELERVSDLGYVHSEDDCCRSISSLVQPRAAQNRRATTDLHLHLHLSRSSPIENP